MTDLQATIGLAQLERLESFIRRRRTIAHKYQRALSSFGFRLPPDDPGHIYFRYVIDLGTDSAPWIRELKEKGIQSARPVHTPLHRYLRQDGYPKTDAAWGQCLSIPIYPSLNDKEINRVIKSFITTCEEVRSARNL
jgi:dTDP-4-amino-4,6-dideoxygalactose transaminase